MNAEQIRQALADGHRVFWSNANYEVIHDSIGQYLIWSRSNDHYIGLTWRDEVTLNGNEDDFYINDSTTLATHQERKDAQW